MIVRRFSISGYSKNQETSTILCRQKLGMELWFGHMCKTSVPTHCTLIQKRMPKKAFNSDRLRRCVPQASCSLLYPQFVNCPRNSKSRLCQLPAGPSS
jgi:hypothetical protein